MPSAPSAASFSSSALVVSRLAPPLVGGGGLAGGPPVLLVRVQDRAGGPGAALVASPPRPPRLSRLMLPPLPGRQRGGTRCHPGPLTGRWRRSASSPARSPRRRALVELDEPGRACSSVNVLSPRCRHSLRPRRIAGSRPGSGQPAGRARAFPQRGRRLDGARSRLPDQPRAVALAGVSASSQGRLAWLDAPPWSWRGGLIAVRGPRAFRPRENAPIRRHCPARAFASPSRPAQRRDASVPARRVDGGRAARAGPSTCRRSRHSPAGHPACQIAPPVRCGRAFSMGMPSARGSQAIRGPPEWACSRGPCPREPIGFAALTQALPGRLLQPAASFRRESWSASGRRGNEHFRLRMCWQPRTWADV